MKQYHMKRKLRIITAILSGAMLIGTLSGCTDTATKQPGVTPAPTAPAPLYTAGSYSATVTGMKEMTVTVTVDSEKITDIQLDHQETEGIGAPVAERMPKTILEIQGLGVDTVAGATLTSTAIVEGVKKCLQDAGASEATIQALLEIKPPEQEKATDETLAADVVVIGAGGAGMAAAVTAQQAGKQVIVIEKAARMGGNTILSGGAINAVDEGSETALANKDSVDWHYQQTFEGGDKQGDPALVRTLVENAWAGVEWLKSIGMEYKPQPETIMGSMWARAHKPVELEGASYFKVYQQYLDKNDGITVLYSTKADQLVVTDGIVTGVKCTGATGNVVTVTANNGVVLSTGGFARNVELREKANAETGLWPKLDASIQSTNAESVTGDGILMAQAVGANLVQMGNIQLVPAGDPITGSISGNIEHSVESRIFINLNGNRFVNEGGRRDEMTMALINQPESAMYMVMDSDTYPTGKDLNSFGQYINDLVDAGTALRAETLEELAEQMGVPAENLVKAVEEYNRHCLGGDLEGQTDTFGRTLFTDTDKVNNGLNNPPYYAGRRVPTAHHTMGGVQINSGTQVIDTQGSIIPGLFAAGEVTGGIHGANRLGGNALADTVVFGRIAGEAASTFQR